MMPIHTATSLESSPQQLLDVAHSCPEEVLANPVLPLLSVEDPAMVTRIVIRARESLLRKKQDLALDKVPSVVWRKATCDVIRLVLEDMPGRYIRGVLSSVTPVLAVDIAEAFCKGEVDRAALSWGRRFAYTFVEHRAKKGATQEEKNYVAYTKTRAEFCGACCASDRAVMWRGAEKALFYLYAKIGELAEIEAKEKFISELLATNPAKKAKVRP